VGLDGAPQPGNEGPVYLESYELQRRFGWAPHVGIVDGDIKLIELPQPELYAQTSDPQELLNLAETDLESLNVLRAALAEMKATAPTPTGAPLDAQTVQKLSALGYVQGEVPNNDGPVVDPKDRLDALRVILSAKGLVRDSKADPKVVQDAILALEKLVQVELGIPEVIVNLARLLEKQGSMKKAISVYEKASKQWPESVNWMLNTAVLYGNLGEFKQVEALARKAYRAEPTSERALEILMTSLFFQGRPDEALALGESYLDTVPDSAVIGGLVGVYRASQGVYPEKSDFLQTQNYLRLGLTARFPRKGIRLHLAIMADASEVPGDVIALAEAELADYPESIRARRLLVKVLGEAKRYTDQIPHLEILVKHEPQSLGVLHALAQALWNAKRFPDAEALVGQGLAKVPDHPELLMLKANILDRKGEVAAAQEAYQAALAAKKAQ
jgi:tetratricopeptide (TPR) repeat protein